MEPYKLLIQLLKAKDENSVKRILEKNDLWNNEKYWRPYGDNDNNEGTTDNQQDNPIAALIEKPINSMDAVLIKECRLRGIDPKGNDAPKSMQEAVSLFFDVRNGDFSEESHTKRRDLAQNVRIIAEGDKKEPNVVIVDFGEGQIPEKFPKTFCSLGIGEGEKNNIEFVQGTFNMGGSGVLPFCGEYHFQLILSRKHPDLANGKDTWGFTLVREHPTESEDEHSWAEYLVNPADKVNVLEMNVFEFIKDELAVLPNSETMSYGTYIKLYNYRLSPSHRSHFGRGFWKEVNKVLYSPPIPMLIQETRFSDKEDRLLLGNRTRIRDHKDAETSRNKIEGIEDYSNARLGIFDDRNIEITVFKEGTHTEGRWGGTDEFTSKEQAVFFTINGQTHYSLPRSFFSSAKLDYLKDELMVHISCTSVPRKRRKKVFLPSRDRIRKSDEFKVIRKDLLEILKNDDWLRKINHIREEKSSIHNAKDQKFADNVFSKLIKVNPEIAGLLNIGDRIKTDDPTNTVKIIIDKPPKPPEPPKPPRPPKPEAPFVGKDLPTFFKVFKWNEEKGIFQKEIPKNSYVRIKFETDASNDYLNEMRGNERGYFKCSMPEILKSDVLRNGIITAKIGTSRDVSVGDKVIAEFELTHPYQESFVQKIEFIIVKALETVDNKGRTKDEPEKNTPNPIPVYSRTQEGIDANDYKTWEDMTEFQWNDKTISQIKEGESTDVYINMDSCYLRNFLKRQRGISDNKRNAITRNYKIAVLLYSVVLRSKIRLLADSIGDDEEKLFQAMMQGVGSIILDLIIDNKRLLDYEDE